MRISVKISPSLVGLTCLLVSIGTLAQSKDFTGKVVGVTDGDTISVMHDGRAEKIRLNGVDCPESSQAFGARAKQFSSGACFGQEVTVKVRDVDRYGRTVADIVLPDGKVLNQKLVRSGMAWWYQEYAPRDTVLKGLEEGARAGKVGLWSDPAPVPPWEFRHGGKSDSSKGAGTDLSQQPSQGPASGEETVYATKTGAKYHAEGCRFLSKSKIPILLKDAKTKGLTPCSVCGPPQ